MGDLWSREPRDDLSVGQTRYSNDETKSIYICYLYSDRVCYTRSKDMMDQDKFMCTRWLVCKEYPVVAKKKQLEGDEEAIPLKEKDDLEADQIRYSKDKTCSVYVISLKDDYACYRRSKNSPSQNSFTCKRHLLVKQYPFI